MAVVLIAIEPGIGLGNTYLDGDVIYCRTTAEQRINPVSENERRRFLAIPLPSTLTESQARGIEQYHNDRPANGVNWRALVSAGATKVGGRVATLADIRNYATRVDVDEQSTTIISPVARA